MVCNSCVIQNEQEKEKRYKSLPKDKEDNMIRSIVTTFFFGMALISAAPAAATPFFFSTGDPDGLIGTAARPTSGGKIEIETGDDFILNAPTNINTVTFVGLLTNGTDVSDLGNLHLEMYRVFPKDSEVGRTSGPPDFSTSQVPTRVNSPSDVAFQERDLGEGDFMLTTSVPVPFTVANSVINGINPKPNQFTGGEGQMTGLEVVFTASFSNPFSLPADHYFFVPQVEVNGGEFLWLSAPKPITGGTGPFNPDLQSWIRNENLAPDWLRIGTDITQQGPFNAAFSLTGIVVPEPSTLFLLGSGIILARITRGKKQRLAS